MSQFQQLLLQAVNALTERFNSLETNAKGIDELDPQETFDIRSRIHVSLDGQSYRLDIWQLVNSIQNSLYNKLIEIGEITKTGNVLSIPSGARWNINGINYVTDSVINITVPLAATDKVRKDIIVANTSGAIVRVAGVESIDFAFRPNVPQNTIMVTEVDVTDASVGDPAPVVYPPSSLIYGAASTLEAFIGGVPRGIFGAFGFVINSTQNLLVQYDGTNWVPLELNPYAELFIWNTGNTAVFELPVGVKAKMVYVNDVMIYNSQKTGHDAYRSWSQSGRNVTIDTELLFDDNTRILITN